jgi:hypothetical protein
MNSTSIAPAEPNNEFGQAQKDQVPQRRQSAAEILGTALLQAMEVEAEEDEEASGDTFGTGMDTKGSEMAGMAERPAEAASPTQQPRNSWRDSIGGGSPAPPPSGGVGGRISNAKRTKRLSMMLTGGVSGAADGAEGIERGISDLDNMSVVCALFLTIFAGFSASVNREELDRIPEGRYLQGEYVRKFWLENFYGVALAVFSMCFCFALRTSLYLNSNTPKALLTQQLERWDNMFIWDLAFLRMMVVAEAVLVARVAGYVYRYSVSVREWTSLLYTAFIHVTHHD